MTDTEGAALLYQSQDHGPSDDYRRRVEEAAAEEVHNQLSSGLGLIDYDAIEVTVDDDGSVKASFTVTFNWSAEDVGYALGVYEEDEEDEEE